MPQDRAAQVVVALRCLAASTGDVEHPRGSRAGEHRLRVGEYRVLSTGEDEVILVQPVWPRGGAYCD